MNAIGEKSQGAKTSEISGWIASAKIKKAITSCTHATTYPITSSVVRIRPNQTVTIMAMFLLTIVKQQTN